MRLLTSDDDDPIAPDARLHVRALLGPAAPELGFAAVVAAHPRGAGGTARSAFGESGRARRRNTRGLRARDTGDVDAPHLLGSLSGAVRRGPHHLYGRRSLPDRAVGHRAGGGARGARPDLSAPRRRRP